MKTLGYVISITCDGKEKFYAIDVASGGYPYWNSNISSAKLFEDEGQPIKIISSDKEFIKEDIYTNGVISPPRMIHSGLNICNSKRLGKGIIYIKPIILGESVFDLKVEGERKEPTGFIYD